MLESLRETLAVEPVAGHADAPARKAVRKHVANRRKGA
jgi:hypothetical protein